MKKGGKETCRLYFIEWIFGRDKRFWRDKMNKLKNEIKLGR